MRQVRLIGSDAINYARQHGLEVHVMQNRAQGPVSSPPDAAEAIAEQDPSQVWIDIETAVSSAD